MAQERTLGNAADRAKRPSRENQTRIPIGDQPRELTSVRGKDPAFEYRIVADKPGRIDKFELAGYEIVNHEVQVGETRAGTPSPEGSPVKISLGGGVQGYLMRQRKEWYDADQQKKMDALLKAEQAMVRRHKEGHYGTAEVTTEEFSLKG